MSELVTTNQVRKFRGSIPEAHRTSLDTRIRWLWHQRFGTIQTIWSVSRTGDMLDHTACTLYLQAIMAHDLEAMQQIISRIEGGARYDTELVEETPQTIRL